MPIREIQAIRRPSGGDVPYVGRFGGMSWVSAQGYTQAEPDPLLADTKRIIGQ